MIKEVISLMHLQKTYILPGNLQAELFDNFKNLDLGPKILTPVLIITLAQLK